MYLLYVNRHISIKLFLLCLSLTEYPILFTNSLHYLADVLFHFSLLLILLLFASIFMFVFLVICWFSVGPNTLIVRENFGVYTTHSLSLAYMDYLLNLRDRRNNCLKNLQHF